MSCHSDALLSPELLKAPIVLVGNPNVGKSVLFGALTGRYATVSNYPGTTVEITSGALHGDPNRRHVVDTPGIYSLLALSDDERVTRDILLDEQPSAVVQVIDAKHLQRGLLITLELAEAGLPCVLALNMLDEAQSRGITIDVDRLSARIGVPVVQTIATRNEGLAELRSSVTAAQRSKCHVTYPAAIEGALADVMRLLPTAEWPQRALAVMFLGGDDDLLERLHIAGAERTALLRIRSAAEAALGEPLAYAINRARMATAQQLLNGVITKSNQTATWSARLGRWAVDPVIGWPILAAVLLAVYWFVGVLGAGALVGFFENVVFGEWINPAVTRLVEFAIPWPLLQEFLVGEFGLITVALTYSFAIVLPIVGTFFFAFSLLEDSGYLPRLAVMLDRLFRLIGLNGKAVLPMILGLGCDTMATVSTRMLETRKERIQVTLLLALGVPCSAQLGVLMGMIGGLGLGSIMIWGGVVLATVIVVGYLAARLIPGQRSDFILELPPMRQPALRNIVVKTAARMEWYVKEVVPVFVIGTAILFVLNALGTLVWLEQVLAPIVVNWLGLPAAATSALLVGFLRRDYGAAGLFQMSRDGLLNPTQVLVSMVVITLFVPCIANVLMIVKEYGARIALGVVATVFPLAILVGGLLNIALHW